MEASLFPLDFVALCFPALSSYLFLLWVVCISSVVVKLFKVRHCGCEVPLSPTLSLSHFLCRWQNLLISQSCQSLSLRGKVQVSPQAEAKKCFMYSFIFRMWLVYLQKMTWERWSLHLSRGGCAFHRETAGSARARRNWKIGRSTSNNL